MAARELPLAADGSAMLRAGRFYRMLLVVNGEPGERELFDAVLRLGFSRGDLALSWPGVWAKDKPSTWPPEAPPMLAANEFLVRASGSFLGPTRAVAADTPIAGEGHFTIAQLWDCGAALEQDAAPAARSRSELAPEGEPKKEGKGTIVAIGVGLGALIMWKLIGGRQEAAREDKRVEDVQMRAHRARRLARINELIHGGHERDDAEALAESEEWEHDERSSREHHHAGEEA